MARRRMPVLESPLLSRLLSTAEPLIHRGGWYSRLSPDLWSYDVFATSRPPLAFTAEEHERGRAQLAAMGLGRQDWFVCFHARDATAPGGQRTAYKRAGIESYRLAVQAITERGGFAMRMGADATAAIPDWGPRVIDYARRWRSDFMDVYLCAHARFFLGSSAGLAYLAVAFNVPVATANLVPLSNPPQSARDRFIPKLLCRAGQPLKFDQVMALGLFEADGARLQTAGITVQDNSPDDIRDLCLDMLDGESPAALALQTAYRERYFGERAGRAPLLGARFARKYQQLLSVAPLTDRAAAR